MQTVLLLGAALVLFVVGLRLSAFFSGVETGFYRVSFLRLSIDAQAGDRSAQRIMNFASDPSSFVATTLVGNNVANYLTTLAIGLSIAVVADASSGWREILATLLLSPVIFLFGELIPKNLYYRAPLRLLRRDISWLVFFDRLFRVFSFPLVGIAKLIERLAGPRRGPLEPVLGRSRLAQVLNRGHQEGLLTDVQNRLVDGLMNTASESVADSVMPADRVLGVDDRTPRSGILEYARQYGLTYVPVRRSGNASSWHGYVRVVDLAVSRRPVSDCIVEMCRIAADVSKLNALSTLHTAGVLYGVVNEGETFVGLVSEHGLVEQLFRPPQRIGPRTTSPV